MNFKIRKKIGCNCERLSRKIYGYFSGGYAKSGETTLSKIKRLYGSFYGLLVEVIFIIYFSNLLVKNERLCEYA